MNFRDEMEEIRRDYIMNVLPHLIPNVPQDLMGMTGSGPGTFDMEISSDAFKGTHYTPASNRFIHFTSLRSLQSILNENTIRLYSLENTNDPNEFRYFAQDLFSDHDAERIQKNTFILSLCNIDVLEKDTAILNLWRLYGDGGLGVAIEFEINVPENGLCNYFLGNIIYQQPDLEIFLEKNAAFESRWNIKMDYKNLFRVPACFHKSPYFTVEEEVRLMIFEDGSKAGANFSIENRKFELDYNSRYDIVTYHKLDLGEKAGHSLEPEIIIRRIHLGFRHSVEFYKDFYIHMQDIFSGKQRRNQWKGVWPKLEHSKLKNIYR